MNFDILLVAVSS